MTDVSNLIKPTNPAIWCGMNRNQLDQAYDNSAAVAESSDYLARWTKRSKSLKRHQPELLDLAYGAGQRNRIDIFRSGTPNAPLFVFIHGGYWQRNSKDIFACMAEGPLAAGMDVALPGYTLAPDATLGEIIEEVHRAIRWLRREGPVMGIATGKLIVSGWSAGGHLAATTLKMPEVDAGLCISGIYDLEPIRLGVLNDKLQLHADDVATYSPLYNLPDGAGEIAIVFGTNELPELQRQSRQFAATCTKANIKAELTPVAGANHFSILEQLASPDGWLVRCLSSLV